MGRSVVAAWPSQNGKSPATSNPVYRKHDHSQGVGTNMKKQKGFSLIELLIVVAIILIIAAIAIPNLLRSKMAANEASAAGSVRSIVTAQVTYGSTYGIGYATALANLGGTGAGCAATSTAACLLDPVLTSGTKSGYNLATIGTLSTFVVSAVPTTPNTTGVRGFCSDETLVVRFDSPATTATTDVLCAAFTPLGN